MIAFFTFLLATPMNLSFLCVFQQRGFRKAVLPSLTPWPPETDVLHNWLWTSPEQKSLRTSLEVRVFRDILTSHHQNFRQCDDVHVARPQRKRNLTRQFTRHIGVVRFMHNAQKIE